MAAGLAAAVASSLWAHRGVGRYGDGPFASGFHRERHPETGRSMLVHEVVTNAGLIRRVFDESSQLAEVRVDTNGDGRTDAHAQVRAGQVTRVDRDSNNAGRIDQWVYYDAARQPLKVGFSLAGDEIVDAWAFRDANNQLTMIEVSTKRDGVVDRWERYANGAMVRVDQDTNKNGRVDRWSTYVDGILMDTFVDYNEDGQPDDPVRR